MPIYEYACACGKVFEELIIRHSDEKDLRCPACQGAEVKRVISQPVDWHSPRYEYKWPSRRR